MAKRAQEQGQGYVELVGTGHRIPVPDDPEGERAAVVADPDFQRRLAAARRQHAEGSAIPMRAVHRRGRPASGDYKGRFLVRVPSSIHRELVERAEREHTTLNQLVLSYLSRGLGADAGTKRTQTT